jgi:BirA family biotin operon repressor/biotin-[acetyl-CoA-carboxylase] ligase
MRNEIVNLLKREKGISDEAAEEITAIDISEFFNIVKEVGTRKTDYIDRERIINSLKSKMFGENIYVYDEVMSTNTIAKLFAEEKFEEGTVIISEKQTKGRGRSGKKWESPLGGIWLSLILRPKINQSKSSLITLATGVAVANTIKSFNIDNVEIKWPNDILINEKKVSGVLTEAVAKLNTIEYIVVGVGIDANLDIDIMPKDLQKGSTSISNELNKQIDEVEVIVKFLEEFEKVFLEFTSEKYENILKEWRRESYSIGKYVNIREPFGKSFDGYIVGINKEGVLIVEKADGTLEKVLSGEYTVKK